MRENSYFELIFAYKAKTPEIFIKSQFKVKISSFLFSWYIDSENAWVGVKNYGRRYGIFVDQ